MDPQESSDDDRHSGYYTYEPLDKDCIRVFRISPTSDYNSAVCGELATISLTKDRGPSPYNALSYYWGPTSPDGSHLSRTIICDGRKLKVTSELETAIKYIRSY